MIQAGFYTVVGYHGRYTFRIETQAADAKFAPGQQVIGWLRGPVNTKDYTSFGFVDGQSVRVWRKHQTPGMARVIAAANYLLKNGTEAQEQAGKAYALESGNCFVCNRLLTTPESIERGIGPFCDAARQKMLVEA